MAKMAEMAKILLPVSMAVLSVKWVEASRAM
jgi:hypothetical protein